MMTEILAPTYHIGLREATMITEGMTPFELENEGIAEMIIDETLKSITHDFKPDFAAELRKKRPNAEKLAELSGYFARVLFRLNAMECDPQRVYETILSEANPDSVVNCLGEDMTDEVLSELKGAYSILTVYDLLRKTSPELFQDANDSQRSLSAIIPPAYVDVNNKIDLEFDSGAIGEINGRQVRISQKIQLKSSSKGRILIARFSKDSAEEIESHPMWIYLKDKIKVGDILKIFGKARKDKEKDSSIISGIFAMIVPAIDSNLINYDPYGRCMDEEAISEFRKQAEDQKLLFFNLML